MITAPFNFVPLSEKVFFPKWADDVSHDIPFEDSQSGVLDITITAKSPIFVRDGGENKEKFCNHNGVPYIPSSSVKGMTRSVLEIMSFSKMSLFNDDTYAVRDLSKADNFYMKEMRDNVLCGWLYKDGESYKIENCDVPYRISHKEIDKALDANFSSKFTRSGFEKTSEYKYNLVGGAYQKVTVGEPYKSKTNPKYDKRLFCKYDVSGKTGTLVLTGQPTVRGNTGKQGDGKGFEFIFFESKEELNISQKVMENFLFAYFDKRTTEPKESPDWKYWKKKLENGEKVPVFFQKNGRGVAHFGLSYLYKLPYAYSVSDGIPQTHSDKRKDLAQTMFGYIGKKEALKGRVQFSHFKAMGTIDDLELESKTEILGTPRASYYPMYVRQYSTDFKTFMDKDFSVAGRKRYPIHRGSNTTETLNTGNDNVGTTFTPLKSEVIFEGKVRYHNLKKEELGALLSALTFHNTEGCFHNIGMAKSLGYGKIELKVSGVDNIEEHLKSFELSVSEQIENWSEQSQLKELLSMATEQSNNSLLKYMELKDYGDHKSKQNKRDYLRLYTELDNIQSITPKSLISTEELLLKKQETEKKEKERKELEKKRKEQQQQKKEEEDREKREEEKANKAGGFNALMSCNDLDQGLKIIKDSLDKKPKFTDEQMVVLRIFYAKCKGNKKYKKKTISTYEGWVK